MNIYYLLLLNLFLLSISKYIIRDLPYNIYQIEDMNLYETKYIPEGNKFFIKFPKNSNNNITFSILCQVFSPRFYHSFNTPYFALNGSILHFFYLNLHNSTLTLKNALYDPLNRLTEHFKLFLYPTF